jgi:hypothetical protein
MQVDSVVKRAVMLVCHCLGMEPVASESEQASGELDQRQSMELSSSLGRESHLHQK